MGSRGAPGTFYFNCSRTGSDAIERVTVDDHGMGATGESAIQPPPAYIMFNTSSSEASFSSATLQRIRLLSRSTAKIVNPLVDEVLNVDTDVLEGDPTAFLHTSENVHLAIGTNSTQPSLRQYLVCQCLLCRNLESRSSRERHSNINSSEMKGRL